jgi:hypothetical protein
MHLWRFTLKQEVVPSQSDFSEEGYVSIVRIGLAETKNFGDGYEAIFGKKKPSEPKKTKPAAKMSAAKKKKKTKKK